MIFKLDNKSQAGTRRLANGNWAAVLRASDGKTADRRIDDYDDTHVYAPADIEVVIEITDADAGGLLQAVLGQTLNCRHRTTHARPVPFSK